MSLDPVAISHLCETAHEFEASVLQEFAAVVGCEAAFLSLVGREDTPSVLGFDAAMVEQAVAGAPAYAAELAPVKRAAFERRGVAVDTDVLGWERVQRTRYYRDVAVRVGGRHSLFAYLSWQKRPIGLVMLGRTGRAFTDKDVRRVETVLPALAVARAAYGLPVPCSPLPSVARPSLLERLGLSGPRVLGTRITPSATVRVRDRAGFREMVATHGSDELVWSRAGLSDPSESGWPYVELFHLAAARAKERTRALFIGCGGAVAVRQFARTYPGIQCDVVESEPAVVELAREFFALDAIPRLTVHVADGAEFVQRAAPERWDIIVVDAYDASSMSTALSSRNFFASLRRALRPGGAVALNVIGTLAAGGLVERITRVLGRELDDVRIHPVTAVAEKQFENTPRNVVLVATSPRA
jgi:SAM-dependent methyltransferase